jgi:hypothetical protein
MSDQSTWTSVSRTPRKAAARSRSVLASSNGAAVADTSVSVGVRRRIICTVLVSIVAVIHWSGRLEGGGGGERR